MKSIYKADANEVATRSVKAVSVEKVSNDWVCDWASSACGIRRRLELQGY